MCSPNLLAGNLQAWQTVSRAGGINACGGGQREKNAARADGAIPADRDRYEKAGASFTRGEYRLYFVSVAWGFAPLLLAFVAEGGGRGCGF